MQIVHVYPSRRSDKKWTAEFVDGGPKIHFGARGYEDFTIHKDYKRMERYDARHASRENWNDAYSAGFWSKWLLWNKPTLEASARDIKRQFNLKVMLSN
jgi:Family of unknown function (DUF5754)